MIILVGTPKSPSTSAPSVSRQSRQCGIRNISQTFKSPRFVTERIFFSQSERSLNRASLHGSARYFTITATYSLHTDRHWLQGTSRYIS
jgi:hypothetical protein